MKVDTYTYDGKKYDIEFLSTKGQFAVEIGDDQLLAPSIEDLKKKIARSQRKASVRIALPATRIVGGRRWDSYSDEHTVLEDVTVTGLHARNRSILIRSDKTKRADTVDDYKGNLLRRLDSKQKTEYLALAKASRESRSAYEAFLSAHQFGKKEIEAAVSTAEKAAGIEEGDDD